MSLIKANAVQIGQSNTATQNFTLAVPSSPNGTIKLARGNSGATTQDVISVDASGNVNGLVKSTGSTTARSLANRFADVLNVKDFGAVGDGVADDSTSIQNAINYCAANSITLFVQSGVYRLLNYINFPSNINIYGEIGSSFYFDPAMTLSPNVGGSPKAFYSQNTNNVFISQIRFYSSATTSKVIQGVFLNIDQIRLTNCQFDTFGNATYYAQGLLLFTCTNVFVDGCNFSNCSGDGIAFSNDCANIFISNTEASNNDDFGIVFTIDCRKISVIGCNFLNNTNTNLGCDRCSDVVFSNNVSEGSAFGIRIARYVDTADVNSSVVILGNVVRGSTFHGISIVNSEASPFSDSGYVCVSSNSVYSCAKGIYVGDIENVSVSSNVIYNSTDEAIIVLAFFAGQTTSNVSVIGNTIDTAKYGIRQLTNSGTMGKISVSGNVITNASIAPLITTNADVFDGNTSANYINVSKSLSFPASVVYTTTATGGAVTPPANVYGYISVYLDGSLKKIPVYNS